MKYDEILAMVMDGSMGYLPPDGINYSLLVKKLYNEKPCDCIFFYKVCEGMARGPYRMLLIDSTEKVILENIDDLSAYFCTDIFGEYELERRDLEHVLQLEADYQVAYDAVSDWVFQEQTDVFQREVMAELLQLLQETSGAMYGMYRLVAPEFIRWLEG